MKQILLALRFKMLGVSYQTKFTPCEILYNSLALVIPGILTGQLLWVQQGKTTEAKNITKTLVRTSNTHKVPQPRIAYACCSMHAALWTDRQLHWWHALLLPKGRSYGVERIQSWRPWRYLLRVWEPACFQDSKQFCFHQNCRRRQEEDDQTMQNLSLFLIGIHIVMSAAFGFSLGASTAKPHWPILNWGFQSCLQHLQACWALPKTHVWFLKRIAP